MNRRSARAGFSLLESVVAVAILGLALPVLFEIVRSAVLRMSAAEHQDTELRMANDLMTEAVAMLDGTGGVREGRQGDLDWRVETAVADEDVRGDPDHGGHNRLFDVRVTVRSPSGSWSDRPVTFHTLKLREAMR